MDPQVPQVELVKQVRRVPLTVRLVPPASLVKDSQAQQVSPEAPEAQVKQAAPALRALQQVQQVQQVHPEPQQVKLESQVQSVPQVLPQVLPVPQVIRV